MNVSFPGHAGTARQRRGMLLLLVLCMLTLFVLLGALAIVIATRSRESARAFADANSGSIAPIVAESMLDEALLTLVRGSKDPAVNALLKDSLLKDMYGTEGKGRFVDEMYDSFDDQNPFLTQVTLDASGRVSGVPRPAFASRGAVSQVDNDGDGQADSVWLDGVLQPITLPDGSRLDFRVAYLVLDLDGRLNVNAHGKRADAPASANGETGPADVNASSLFTSAVWSLLMERTGGQLLSGSVSPSPDVQWRPAPPISSPVDGRFGGLKDASGGPECDTYKLRLDLEAARPGAIANAATQNPFTLGELERVLRQFDADASTLPPRLAGIFYDRAERARMRITTDNWETPGDRMDIKWEADNSGVTDEKADWAKLWPRVVAAGAPEADAKQWVANLLDFRDMDKAETTFDGPLKGTEPSKQSIVIPGKWDRGFFESYAALLAVPKGTAADWQQRIDAGQPLVSLVKEYPKILEAVMVRSLFESTVAVDPAREPARVNVNTCDGEVWKVLLGADKPNPYATAADGTGNAAKQTADILLNVPLVFSDPNYDVRYIDHNVANRLANVSTVRSHVFAVWITLEVKRSVNPDQPTYHRLFAIVDRSILVQFTGATEGQNKDGNNKNFRDTIRLQRFLN